jgi:hypothetical protein
MRLSHRLKRLEHQHCETKPYRIVIQWEGPGSECHCQPSQDELDQATQVITIMFVGSPEPISTDGMLAGNYLR